jgi:hypothetical protein
MRAGPRLVAVLALVTSPLLVAASDPSGDVAPCPDAADAARGQAPDLVSARGRIVELGTSALWTLRFADDLEVPDEDGKPFRVDLVLRDPAAPVVRFTYYRDLNRLIRYDAVRDPSLTILLLPERGRNVFLAPAIEGVTMTFQVPGRILSADEDETGTSPGIANMRWSVVVRDEGSCDLLGNGRPSEPMTSVPAPSTAPSTGTPTGIGPPSEDPGSGQYGSRSWLLIAAGGVFVIGGIAYVVSRWGAR